MNVSDIVDIASSQIPNADKIIFAGLHGIGQKMLMFKVSFLFLGKR